VASTTIPAWVGVSHAKEALQSCDGGHAPHVPLHPSSPQVLPLHWALQPTGGVVEESWVGFPPWASQAAPVHPLASGAVMASRPAAAPSTCVLVAPSCERRDAAPSVDASDAAPD